MAYSSEQIAEIASRSIDVSVVIQELVNQAAEDTRFVEERLQALDCIQALEQTTMKDALNFNKVEAIRGITPGLVQYFEAEVARCNEAVEALTEVVALPSVTQL